MFTSTPPSGGINFRVGIRSGSVGAYAITYGNFSTGSFGYQDMTILKMNRKPNPDRKGPRKPIASFAVAGSKSTTTNLCINSDAAACDVSTMPMVAFDAESSIMGGAGTVVTPMQQHVVL
ncbi:unnamed protein product [Camellia sinensis]